LLLSWVHDLFFEVVFLILCGEMSIGDDQEISLEVRNPPLLVRIRSPSQIRIKKVRWMLLEA